MQIYISEIEMLREKCKEWEKVCNQHLRHIKKLKKKRTWVGLTDDEKEKFVVAYYPSNWDRKTAVALMNNYEAYLKEKNT